MAKYKKYVVKETGFTGHLVNARTRGEAFRKYQKKYGHFGGSVGVGLNTKSSGRLGKNFKIIKR